jgi:hypothetical protein
MNVAIYESVPSECDAEQFLPEDGRIPRGVNQGNDAFTLMKTFWVTTMHGQKTIVSSGDWIICEPDGIHFYPCKDQVFKKRWKLKGT